ncbi:MAG: hypothetical protein ACREVY_10455 [Gammaproteobacteria bacterium]
MIDKTAPQEAQQITHMRDTANNELRTAEENQAIKAKLNAEAAGYTDERDLANELIGRIQLANGLSKVATVASLLDLARMKEHKLYRALAGKTYVTADGETGDVATWDHFCAAMGMSRRKVDEDLQNLGDFGEEALNAMKKIGLGYRDLRKLRRFPEDDRAVILGEVEVNVGDRDAIVSLIDDLAAKHAREKESLEKRNAGLQADLDSSRERVAEKNNEIEELEEQIDHRDRSPADERTQELTKRIEGEIAGVLGAIHGLDAAICVFRAIVITDSNRLRSRFPTDCDR